MSIHKLCSDNNIFIEFHLHQFFIKDNHSKNIFLLWPIDKGFYKVYDTQDASQRVNAIVNNAHFA